MGKKAASVFTSYHICRQHSIFFICHFHSARNSSNHPTDKRIIISCRTSHCDHSIHLFDVIVSGKCYLRNIFCRCLFYISKRNLEYQETGAAVTLAKRSICHISIRKCHLKFSGIIHIVRIRHDIKRLIIFEENKSLFFTVFQKRIIQKIRIISQCQNSHQCLTWYFCNISHQLCPCIICCRVLNSYVFCCGRLSFILTGCLRISHPFSCFCLLLFFQISRCFRNSRYQGDFCMMICRIFNRFNHSRQK